MELTSLPAAMGTIYFDLSSDFFSLSHFEILQKTLLGQMAHDQKKSLQYVYHKCRESMCMQLAVLPYFLLTQRCCCGPMLECMAMYTRSKMIDIFPQGWENNQFCSLCLGNLETPLHRLSELYQSPSLRSAKNNSHVQEEKKY